MTHSFDNNVLQATEPTPFPRRTKSPKKRKNCSRILHLEKADAVEHNMAKHDYFHHNRLRSGNQLRNTEPGPN